MNAVDNRQSSAAVVPFDSERPDFRPIAEIISGEQATLGRWRTEADGSRVWVEGIGECWLVNGQRQCDFFSPSDPLAGELPTHFRPLSDRNKT